MAFRRRMDGWKGGWGETARNRMGGFPQITGHLLLMASGRYYEKGLYAHSPSRFEFQLGGKWKSFETGAALQDGDFRTARFIVRADGKEICRSPLMRAGRVEQLKADVTGVKVLELTVEGGEQEDGHSWSVWLEPKVARP